MLERERSPFLSPEHVRRVDRPLARAATLPGPVFSDPSVYAEERRRLFLPAWHCVAREDDFPGPGDFRAFDVLDSGVVVLRGSDGRLRAFHNVCRHRGTRLVESESGQGLRRIQCPYHAWTYDLSGRLLGAPDMAEAEGFDRADFGLHPVALETWRGFVFVNLSPKPEPLARYLGDLGPRAAPYPLERLRRAFRVTYDIAANWKLVVQNANECYHCPGVHPQLVRLTPHRSGEEDMVRGPIFGGWMDFVDGVRTLTANGNTTRAPFRGLTPEDLRRVYYYVLFPANFLAFLPDYVTLDWFVPQGPERTRLVFDLFVDRDEPDAARDAMDFWETTNRQDWHICELAHLGSKTVAYEQGRYSGLEGVVHRVDRYYLERMGRLGTGGTRRTRRSPRARARGRRRGR
jgi:Rieske 2Fe-2S family protein